MKTKKISLRSCVITKEKLEKKDLIRVVRTPDSKVEIDLTGKLNGRGAYIKKDVSVVAKAKKSKLLDKNLEVVVPDEIYDQLIEIINK